MPLLNHQLHYSFYSKNMDGYEGSRMEPSGCRCDIVLMFLLKWHCCLFLSSFALTEDSGIDFFLSPHLEVLIFSFLFFLFCVFHVPYVLCVLVQGAGPADCTTWTCTKQRKSVWTYSISQRLWQLRRGHKDACVCWRSQGEPPITDSSEF